MDRFLDRRRFPKECEGIIAAGRPLFATRSNIDDGRATVRRVLSGPSFAALSLKLSRLARLEIPRLMKRMPSDNLTQFAQRALGKKLRRALKLAKLRHSDLPEDLHQLRKALRKARYLGEFFAPVLGPPFDKLTRRIHAAERALGKIHDADAGLTLALRAKVLPRHGCCCSTSRNVDTTTWPRWIRNGGACGNSCRSMQPFFSVISWVPPLALLLTMTRTKVIV